MSKKQEKPANKPNPPAATPPAQTPPRKKLTLDVDDVSEVLERKISPAMVL